jgi:hypothetical protein
MSQQCNHFHWKNVDFPAGEESYGWKSLDHSSNILPGKRIGFTDFEPIN